MGSEKTRWCKIRANDTNLKNHGFQTLVSHAKGNNHNDTLRWVDGITSLTEYNSCPSTPLTENDCQSSAQQTTLCTNKQGMTQTEIVVLKYSFISSSNKNNLFSCMFPAQDCTCGKTMFTYIVNHGVAPYFTEHLNAQIDDASYVALFD